MNVFWHILKIKILSIYRGFLSGGSKRRLLVFVPIIFLPYFSFTSSLELFQSWALAKNIGPQVYANYLSTTFLGFFIFLSFGGIPIALHQFTKASDLQILLSKPVSRKMFFQLELLISSAYNSPLVMLFGLPVFFAYLYSAHVSPVYYILFVIAICAFIQYPTFFATMAALLFLKLAGFTKAKNIATAMVAVLFLAGWAGFQFLRLSTFNPTSTDFNQQHLLKLSNVEFLNFLPSTILTKILLSMAQADLLSILINGMILVIGAFVLLAAGAKIVDVAFNKDWPNSAPGKLGKFEHISSRRSSVFSFSSPVFTLIKKDLLIIWRDSRQTTSILMLMVILIVFPFFLDIQTTNFGQIPPFGFVAIFSSIVVANISSRLIPFEGLAFRWNLIYPQPMINIYVAKVFTAFLITIGPALIGLFVMVWRYKLNWQFLAMLIFLLIGLILNSATVGIFMGLKYANFKWENPKQVLQQPGAFYLIILALVVTVVGLGIYLPMYYFLSGLLAIVLFLLLVVGLQFMFLRLSIKRLTKLEWHF